MAKLKSTVKALFGLAGMDVRILPPWDRPRRPWLADLDIRTVIDVGANEGQFASKAFGLFPKATVHSFEPLDECFRKMNTKMAGKPRFCSYPLALGSSVGEFTIHKKQARAASSILEEDPSLSDVFPGVGGSVDEKINMKKLDDAIRELGIALDPAILVKIDVQGYEDRVILGGEKTIKEAAVVITEVSFLELYREQALFGRVYSLLTDLGFLFAGEMDQILDRVTGRPVQADALFIKDPKQDSSRGRR